jgi:hypothetical protein
VTDDPRGILRESRAAARAAESEEARTPVSSARRPRASDESGHDASEQAGAPRRDASEARERSSSAVSGRRSSDVFSTLVGTRAYVRNAREAAASLDLPALGLAKPSREDFSDELFNLTRTDQSARVLPDGSGGAAFSCEWRLREPEVVLVVGCTPPPAKYFGITPYVYKSYDAGIVRTLFASAGDTLAVGGDDGSGTARFARLGTSAARVETNADGTMGVVRDVRCWNSTFAAAFGGHTRVLRDAIDVLRTHAGSSVPFIENALNAYGLSRQTGVKTRALMIRHAVPANARDWAAYAESPPFIVMRLTPRRAPIFPAPFPRAPLIRRETFDETPLASSIALVAERAAALFRAGGVEATTFGLDAFFGDEGFARDEGNQEKDRSSRGSKNTWFDDVPGTYETQIVPSPPAQILFDNGQRCVDTAWNCGGDNRDTTYVNGPRFSLPDDRTVAYVVGANHAATGNAVYANVAVYDPARKLGVLAIDDGEFENTAAAWTEGTPAERDAAKLFVVALARKCPPGVFSVDDRGDANSTRHLFDGADASPARARRSRMPDGTLCVEVPSEGFPSASPDAELAVWARPYCHAETTVGPWWSRLATPTAVLVRRTGDAPPAGTTFPFDALDTF